MDESIKIPHQAIITIKVEIMEKLRTGEVSGKPKEVTRKHFTISGSSLQDIKDKVNQLYERINNEK